MLKIAVCDDVPHMAQRLGKIIEKYVLTSELKDEISDIDIYNDTENIINHAEEYNIVFLDIGMPKIDGIEAGRIIRKINPNIIIIIASGIVERFKETYEINTLSFITKPYDEQEINFVLKLIEERIAGQKCIKVFRNKYSINLMQKDIMYIEAYEGVSRIHTMQGEYRLYESLNKIIKRLDNRFFVRIHRSYIVNMKWITKYEKGILKIGNCKFRVSRKKKKEFEYNWMRHGF